MDRPVLHASASLCALVIVARVTPLTTLRVRLHALVVVVADLATFAAVGALLPRLVASRLTLLTALGGIRLLATMDRSVLHASASLCALVV